MNMLFGVYFYVHLHLHNVPQDVVQAAIAMGQCFGCVTHVTLSVTRCHRYRALPTPTLREAILVPYLESVLRLRYTQL
jgi:hypothetical protein